MLNNRWHAFESELDPKAKDYNDSHVKFCFKCLSQTRQGCSEVKFFSGKAKSCIIDVMLITICLNIYTATRYDVNEA